MTTLRLCDQHVNKLRELLTAQGAGRLLPPPGAVLKDYDLDSEEMPDLLSIAIAHVMVCAATLKMSAREADQINHGRCVACCQRSDGSFPFSARQAIHLFMQFTPSEGHA
jgi:hypothetical protein